MHLYAIISVTRWLDCLFNIWPFTAMKISPIAFFGQNMLKIVAILKNNIKIIAKYFENIANLAKFRQISSHWLSFKPSQAIVRV